MTEKFDLANLRTFIRQEVDTLAAIAASPSKHSSHSPSTSGPSPSSSTSRSSTKIRSTVLWTNTADDKPCIFCGNSSHKLGLTYCDKFKELDCSKRRSVVADKKLCFNCLRVGHSVQNCRNPERCKICRKSHHSLLHILDDTKVTSNVSNQCNDAKGKKAILSTVVIKTTGPGDSGVFRCLFDSGSEMSYIRKDVARKLGLKPIDKRPFLTSLFGGLQTSHLREKVSLKLGNANDTLSFWTADQLTTPIESVKLPVEVKQMITNLNLNVNDYQDDDNKAKEIHSLIGADLFWLLIRDEVIRLNKGLVFINSSLGGFLHGSVPADVPYSTTSGHIRDSVAFSIEETWELENVGISNKELNVDMNTQPPVISDSTGRMEVRLP